MRLPDPSDPRLLAVGTVVSAAIVLVIAVAHTRPVPAPRMERWAIDREGVTLHVGGASPCTTERVALACERWARHGWPRCTAQPTGGLVEVVTYGGTERGAVAEGAIGIRPDACGSYDPTLEHEIGHLLYDLDHVTLSGSVMCSHAPAPDLGEYELQRPDCAGLRMPEAP